MAALALGEAAAGVTLGVRAATAHARTTLSGLQASVQAFRSDALDRLAG